MSDEVWKLKQKLPKMSNDELIELVTVGAGEYSKEALDYATAELKYRRIDLSNPETKETKRVEELAAEQPEPVVDALGPLCFLCGGTRFRPATLVADEELTIVFSDKHEERFVRVNVCVHCGQLSLTVDYDTEVTP